MATVCLEVGHGPYRDRNGRRGFEKGAVGPGCTEYDEVVAMSYIVEGRLKQKGHEVIVLDPQETLYWIGQSSKGADVMVSLHLNAFNKDVQGTETLIHRAGTREDERLARILQGEIVKALRLRDRGVKRSGLALLGGVPPCVQAACLTESFFIDSCKSAEEVREKSEAAARAIANGILLYCKSL